MITVPGVVMPVTATLYVVGPPDTVAVLVPPAVPLIVMSPVAKPVTVSLKTTVKVIGLVPVGSAWPPAWLIVTVGATLSQLTVLSVEVDAGVVAHGIRRARRGDRGDDRARRGHPGHGDRVGRRAAGDGAGLDAAGRAPTVTSPVMNPLTASLKMTVYVMGLVPVGSDWPTA